MLVGSAVGSSVRSVKRGDAVICHPLRTCGVCYGCRRGEDMYCENGSFPGLNRDGGFANLLLTNERALIKLSPNVAPIDVAPLADAGITAYRVAKKAAKLLTFPASIVSSWASAGWAMSRFNRCTSCVAHAPSQLIVATRRVS